MTGTMRSLCSMTGVRLALPSMMAGCTSLRWSGSPPRLLGVLLGLVELTTPSTLAGMFGMSSATTTLSVGQSKPLTKHTSDLPARQRYRCFRQERS